MWASSSQSLRADCAVQAMRSSACSGDFGCRARFSAFSAFADLHRKLLRYWIRYSADWLRREERHQVPL